MHRLFSHKKASVVTKHIQLHTLTAFCIFPPIFLYCIPHEIVATLHTRPLLFVSLSLSLRRQKEVYDLEEKNCFDRTNYFTKPFVFVIM